MSVPLKELLLFGNYRTGVFLERRLLSLCLLWRMLLVLL
jgi:hypothetical protein